MKHLAFLLLLTLPALAGAQSAEPAAAPAAPAAEATVVTGDDVAARPREDRCIRESGTRIKRKADGPCNGLAGDSYSREQIDRTGATDTADALRKLGTSGTVRRGH